MTHAFFLLSPLIDTRPFEAMQYFFSILLPTAVMLLILGRWLLEFALSDRAVEVLTPPELWFLAFLVYMALFGVLLSVPLMGREILGETGMVKSVKQSIMVGIAVMFFLVSVRIGRRERLETVYRALLWTLGALLGYGLLEYLEYVYGVPLLRPIEYLLHPLKPVSAYGLFSERLRLTTPEPSMAAPYLVIYGLLVLFLRQKLGKRGLGVPLLLLAVLVLLLVLGSKGALLSLLLGLFVTTWVATPFLPRRLGRGRIFWGSLVLFLVLTGLSLVSKTGRELMALSVYENTVLTRAIEMLVGLKLFVEHPVFGIGAGNLVFYFNDYLNRVGIISQELFWVLKGLSSDVALGYKNLFIAVLAEGGLVGFFLFAGFLGSVFRQLLRTLRHDRAGLYLVLIFVFILATMMYTDGFNRIYWWIGLGLVAGLSQRFSAP